MFRDQVGQNPQQENFGFLGRLVKIVPPKPTIFRLGPPELLDEVLRNSAGGYNF
jgi:hypothetical protein